MEEKDYDNPEIEEQWCEDQRKVVTKYLQSQNVKHGQIGEWPAWHLAPYIAVWAIESLAKPGWIGWWVISGDLPTDYISSADVKPPQHPRKAMRVFANNWMEIVKAWKNGKEHDDISIGDPSSHKKLGPLLEIRANMLMEYAADDSIWEKEDKGSILNI